VGESLVDEKQTKLLHFCLKGEPRPGQGLARQYKSKGTILVNRLLDMILAQQNNAVLNLSRAEPQGAKEGGD